MYLFFVICNNMTEGKYVCPLCGAHLIWTHNGTPGQKTRIICGNNPAASRVDFRLRDLRFCSWIGICEKDKNGKILFKDQDGICLRMRY